MELSGEPVWGACAVERRGPPGWEGAGRKTTPRGASLTTGLCQPGFLAGSGSVAHHHRSALTFCSGPRGGAVTLPSGSTSQS